MAQVPVSDLIEYFIQFIDQKSHGTIDSTAMSLLGRSYIRSEDLNNESLAQFFQKVSDLQKIGAAKITTSHKAAPVAALLFFEPSTRTRFSFEMAAKRLGIQTLTLDSAAGTSLSKGETLLDTIENIAAMKPDILVVRHSGNPDVNEYLRQSKIPVINAGDGTDEHPTQALLDAFTVLRRRGQVKGEKLLFVGDIKHSRVAQSDFKLFSRLGIEVGYCGPAELLPDHTQWAKAQRFEELSAGLEWCDTVMGLRLQQERHSGQDYLDLNQYIQKYRLDFNSLASLKKNGLIMHPGPFVPEVDLSTDVLKDPRCVIHEQVENGVYVRMALLAEILGIKIGSLA